MRLCRDVGAILLALTVCLMGCRAVNEADVAPDDDGVETWVASKNQQTPIIIDDSDPEIAPASEFDRPFSTPPPPVPRSVTVQPVDRFAPIIRTPIRLPDGLSDGSVSAYCRVSFNVAPSVRNAAQARATAIEVFDCSRSGLEQVARETIAQWVWLNRSPAQYRRRCGVLLIPAYGPDGVYPYPADMPPGAAHDPCPPA